jgi:drug/metabolite transporter (DMT)-like permease
MEDRIKGSLFIIAASFLYSFIGVLSRLAGINVFALVFYKVALSAFFFFLIYAFAGRDAGKLRMDWGKTKFFVPYGFVVAVTELTFIGAYLNTTMVNTIFLGALAPVFVAVLSFLFLKDRVDSRTLFSLAIGIVGVGFIVGADVFGMLNEKNLFGDVLALIYAMCYAVFIIYGRERAKKNMDIYYSVFWSYALAALFILPVNLAYGAFAIPVESAVWIALLAFICTNIAFILLCKGFEYIDATRGSISTLSEQMFVTIIAFLFFGENLTLLAIAGSVLICLSVILTEMKR